MTSANERSSSSTLVAPSFSRRSFLRGAAGFMGLGGVMGCLGRFVQGNCRLSTFSADITPPIGHPLIGGSWLPRAKRIVDPLSARGLVFLGPSTRPIVLVALDWCELRNQAYNRWREVMATAAGSTPQRVLLHCVHQHDAPYADLEAQRLLEEHQVSWKMFDRSFFERSLARVAKALKRSLDYAQPVTHLGLGRARVEQIASNRRAVLPDGTISYSRGSTTRDKTVRSAPKGTIDPWLRMLSFWNSSEPLAAVSSYATHPMSYYGRGGVSADFVGRARTAHQAEHPNIFQVYLTGCSGDVTGGKYNDPEEPETSRQQFADRLRAAMNEAWIGTVRSPITKIDFRCESLALEPRSNGPFAPAAMRERMENKSLPRGDRIQAALGLSWHQRVASGKPIDVPVVDFGPAAIVILPAEAFVGYQLLAQQYRPDSMIIAAGYGECAPGYLPTAHTWQAFVSAHGDYCWTTPGSAGRMKAVIHRVLRSP